MALLLIGRSTCPICRNVIEADDDVVMFPAFVLNPADPLYPLSDASCHEACLLASPLAAAADRAMREHAAKTGPGKRICVACATEIRSPDDYFQIGYLADRRADRLGTFNFTNLHRSHISRWRARSEFLELARSKISSGEWEGGELAKLVSQVS